MLEIRNPFTGKVCGAIPVSSADDVAHALHLSHQAENAMSARDRAALLGRVALRLAAEREQLALLITDEAGLSLKDSRHEVERAVVTAQCAAAVAEGIEADTTFRYRLPADRDGARLQVITEPLDLVVGITPFNHPLNQVAHKVFPAIAAGASIVLKPSPRTPLSALKLVELLHEEGLPPNRVNAVVSDDSPTIVEQLVSSQLLDLVTFTGSREVGLAIVGMMLRAGNALKQYVLELGGSSPFIVAEDADLHLAAELAVKGCFGNSGQRCTAIRRILVVEKVADVFVNLLVQRASRLRCGNPYDPDIDMGTVISEEAGAAIERRVEIAVRDGAVLRLGNRREGALYWPTVVDHVHPESELVACETFGPVAPVIRVRGVDHAVELAARSDYALSGAIVTGRRDVAYRVADALKVGQFNWNGTPSYRTEMAPFGGFKGSGNGQKEGVLLAAEGMRRIRTFYEH